MDVLSAEYGWTKEHCFFRLYLSDIFNYVGARNNRIRMQNGDTPSEKNDDIIQDPTVEEVMKMFGGGNYTVSQA